jgi:hypothetical protein
MTTNMNIKTADITDIAKAIRKDIRKAIKDGKLPTMKTSVRTSRFSGGQSLTVEIKSFDGAIHTEDYLRQITADQNYQLGTLRYSDEMTKAIETLESIVGNYRYDNSDPMTDYFECNFYRHINVDFELEQAEKAEYAEKAERERAEQSAATEPRSVVYAQQMDLF